MRAAYSGSAQTTQEIPLKSSFIAAAFAIAMGVLASGCAGTGSAGNGNAGSSAATPASGSGVTVFGTIDASVSGTTNKSSR